jgi:hypothetical protein
MKDSVKRCSVLFVLCGVACTAPPPLDERTASLSGASDVPPRVLRQQGLTAAAEGGDLVDNGGRIVPVSHTYAIWWGDTGAFPADAQSGIDALLAGFDLTAFLYTTAQYSRGNLPRSYFIGNWYDPSPPPPGSPSTQTIVNEACSVIAANGATPDPYAIYFVYTTNFPGGVDFCAWHSYGTCQGYTIQVAYMPNTSGVGGCDGGDLYGCNGYSQGTRSLANVTSHEAMEAITDATLSAWQDSDGSEIGDKCAWQFQGCIALNNGTQWQLQTEWSNASGGCVTGMPPPPTPSEFVNFGSGGCMGVPGGSTAPNVQLVQWNCNGSNDQNWIRDASHSTVIGNLTYTPWVDQRSGQCIGVASGSRSAGAAVVQSWCNGSPDQSWARVDRGGGVTDLVNLNSGMCVGVAGGNRSPGAKIVQWPCTGAADQGWEYTGPAGPICEPQGCPPGSCGYQSDGCGRTIVCGDPCCGDPCCGDPCCGDPCCGDPCCGGTCSIDSATRAAGGHQSANGLTTRRGR